LLRRNIRCSNEKARAVSNAGPLETITKRLFDFDVVSGVQLELTVGDEHR
jgi:hypothetical protein